jgi:predicted hydrocarbon binding protein
MFELFTDLIAHRRLKFDEGKIELLGQSVTMIPLDYLVTLQKGLEKQNNSNVLYFSSKEMGYRWFKNMYNYFKIRPEDVTRWGVNTLSIAGWGKMLSVDVDLKGERMTVRVSNAAQAVQYGLSDHPVDSFIRGCYASGATVLFGKDCDCVELSCISQGASFCEFLAQPREKFDSTDAKVARQINQET